MYEALAMAIEQNHGSAADVKKALSYAADRAQQSHNPNDLVRVADTLFRKGYYARVGALLDEAMDRLSHRFEPIAMSINLAAKTEDPTRMAESIDRLLSLGWPGRDDYLRTEARNQADRLAKLLREQGRRHEAESLLNKLIESEARDVFVRLTWDGEADYDLAVEEPLGATANFETPRTVFGGAIIKNGYGSHPEEVYDCPRAFNGDYRIRIENIWTDPSKPVTRLTLETFTHEGTTQEKKQVHEIPPDDPGKPIVVTVKGGRRKVVLPFFDPVANFHDEATRALRRDEAIRARMKPAHKGNRGVASKKSSSPIASQPPSDEPEKPKPKF
jgi:hypothetical protein